MTTWFPILGAPAAWLLQALLGWLVSTWTCSSGLPTRAIVLGLSGVALAVALAAFAAAWTGWRRQPRDDTFAELAGWTRPDFAAASAVLLSAVSVLAIVATGAPAFLLTCEAMR